MSLTRLLASAALGACLVATVDAAPSAAATPAPHTTAAPGLPGSAALSARAGALWLAGQFGPGGAIPSATTPGQPDDSATANAVLALASAGTDTPVAQQGLAYLAAHVNDYVQVGGVDQPGALALLVLDAHALGVDPRTFGGTDLVARLEATQLTAGSDAGLFGTSDPTYDGAYRQGLSLAALAAAGVTTGATVTAAEAWLTAQQCPGGGWTSYLTASNPCNGAPANYAGPDTNSTALAVLGLAAEGAAPSALTAALGFLRTNQNPDGGWGYYPTNTSDPDSTGLVAQALAALGVPAVDPSLVQPGGTPVTSLASFQVLSGPGSGAFTFPGVPGPDLLATYQALPGLADVALPFRSTAVTVSVPPGGAAPGAPATYTATVGLVGSPAGGPTGTVTFTEGSSELCAAPVVGGTSSCSGAATPVGAAPVLAVFTGGPSLGISTAAAASGPGGAYWVTSADGGVFAYGPAGFFGSAGGQTLDRPVVGMAATPDGHGYWLVASDGGIFAYGSARFAGGPLSEAGGAPVVGMAGESAAAAG